MVLYGAERGKTGILKDINIQKGIGVIKL